MGSTYKIAITNIFSETGDYFLPVLVGSQKVKAALLIDTGSSTLGVATKAYHPNEDQDFQPTKLAQSIGYGSGTLTGPVVETTIEIGELVIPNIPINYAVDVSGRGLSGGIIGLGFRNLNAAFVYKHPTYPNFTSNSIPGYGIKPVPNPPKRTTVTPFFTFIAEAGLVADQFALYTLRSQPHFGAVAPEKDPLNQGCLILGGGESETEFYSGEFQTAKLSKTGSYGITIKSMQVGDSTPIPMNVLAAAEGSGIVDSGTPQLLLPQTVFDTMLKQMNASIPTFTQFLDEYGFQKPGTTITKEILDTWPNLIFTLEGTMGDVVLKVSPHTYWQVNANKNGGSSFVIFYQDPSNGNSSILGLPLLNNYFTIFDRSGKGGMKFAAIKQIGE